jgi:nitrous oxidase accessory protein NosD
VIRAAVTRRATGAAEPARTYRGWMVRPAARFAVLGLLVLTACGPTGSPGRQHGPSASATTDSGSPPPAPAAGPAVPCDVGDVVDVADAAGLQRALDGARPGQVIRLADGRYEGQFVARAQGSAESPIRLCGSRNAVLDGGGVEHGYTLHLDGASYWQVSGITVTGGQKGVMVDSGVGNRIEGLLVTSMGHEAIHLRRNSTGNVVAGNAVRDTGRLKAKYGEGIYIGSAHSNWCRLTHCRPDRSDGNDIEGNDIAGTTAEAVDIKEGTSNGVLRGNLFDGSQIVRADSWVDVKGNSWTIEGNTGTSSPLDGFQVHEAVAGWGRDTVFSGNRATVNGPGYGINVAAPSALRSSTTVRCDNVTVGAERGLSNVDCSGG